jgi:hypothetical protein
MAQEPKWKVQRGEPEHEGPLWKHPYILYVLLTCALFAVLLFAGWLAWTNGWIPNRGVHS